MKNAPRGSHCGGAEDCRFAARRRRRILRAGFFFRKPEVRSVCFFNFPHFLYLMIAPCAQDSGQTQNGHGDDEPFSGEVGEQEEGGHVGADMEQDTGMERTVQFGGVGQKKSHAEAIKALRDIAVEQAEGSGA